MRKRQEGIVGNYKRTKIKIQRYIVSVYPENEKRGGNKQVIYRYVLVKCPVKFEVAKYLILML